MLEFQQFRKIYIDWILRIMTLTYRRPKCNPGLYTPPCPCVIVTACEDQIDHIAPACDDPWQDRIDNLSSNYYVAIGGTPASLFHQGCPVAVRDFQVVDAGIRIEFNVKGSELKSDDQSFVHFYCLCRCDVVGIVTRVVW